MYSLLCMILFSCIYFFKCIFVRTFCVNFFLDAPAVRRKLKKTAVPSLHLPKGTHELETKRRSLTKIYSSSNINRSLDGHTTQQNVTSNKNDSATSVFDVEQSAVEALLLLSTSQYNPQDPRVLQDISKKD